MLEQFQYGFHGKQPSVVLFLSPWLDLFECPPFSTTTSRLQIDHHDTLCTMVLLHHEQLYLGQCFFVPATTVLRRCGPGNRLGLEGRIRW